MRIHYVARIVTGLINPALEAFARQPGSELVMAEALVSRHGPEFEIRHVADRLVPPEKLRVVPFANLREFAQFTDTGDFRPLKSAPNLRQGWRVWAPNNADLATALNHLYPGALADWHSCRDRQPPLTNYREFTNRQTGMYRITQKLSDHRAAQVIRACCHVRFCLKERLWSIEGLATDDRAGKSIVPCLEPCALLLEFARTVARIDQSSQVQPAVAIRATTDPRLPHGRVAEADFSDPENPRRRRLALESSQEPILCVHR